jgi:uroporphyrinogen decarboxylase
MIASPSMQPPARDSGARPLGDIRPGNRRRYRDALARRFTGEVPFFEYYMADPVVDRVMGRPMGTSMIKLPAEDYVEFLKRTGIDVAYLYEGWPLGRRNFIDDRGRVHYVDGTIKSRADFDQINPPSLDLVRRRLESYLQAAEGTGLGCAYALDGACVIANTAIGPTDILLAMVDDPDFVHEFMDRVEEYTLPLVDCVAQYPVDACFISGPMCATNGPVIYPAMHEEFIFPRMEKILVKLRKAGIPVVLHTDGDNTLFMDRIVGMGISAIHPVQPGPGDWNIYELKRRYGDKLCLCGNIDMAGVLSAGTPDEVRADTLEHLRRLSPGGGYMCGSSHEIGENIPFENFRALAQTVCSYRAGAA